MLMIVRHSRPISPISEPSRANTCDDCGGVMSCHASTGGACWAGCWATSALERSADPTRNRSAGIWLQVIYPLPQLLVHQRLTGPMAMRTATNDLSFDMAPLHLAIAQYRPKKGDAAANTKRIGEILAQAAALDPAADVVHFAETVLSGYFVEGAV